MARKRVFASISYSWDYENPYSDEKPYVEYGYYSDGTPHVRVFFGKLQLSMPPDAAAELRDEIDAALKGAVKSTVSA